MISSGAEMSGSYDPLQVALSVLIAISASYAALDLGGRVTAARGWFRATWLSVGAVAMGIGIWSMHFTGMLAFHLPVQIDYFWPTVLASLVVAILAAAGALHVVGRQRLGAAHTAASAVILGSGIAGLHYMDMAAMRLAAVCTFSSFLVALSVLFAITFSLLALWLAFYFRDDRQGIGWRKIGSAVLMGAAISVMHYTGMAAATFFPSSVQPNLSSTVSISSLGTLGIAAATMLVLGLAVVSSTVDRRFEAQALALRTSEERYRQLFERSLAGVYRATLNGPILDCNDAYAQILGYSSTSELPVDAGRDIHLGSTDWEDFVGKLREQKILSNFERRLWRKDGRLIWVLENATIVEGKGGSPSVVEGTLIDITERKRAQENAVEESRKHAEQTVQDWQKRLELAERAGLRIGLWDWDVTTNTVVWSDESYRQFGFDRNTFSGWIPEAVARIHPEDRARVEKAIGKVLAGGGEYAEQYRVVRPDKSICWIDARGVLVGGRTLHVLGIGIDITDQKTSEQSLQQARIELARIARIATVGELTASIAHEINQPLAAVVTNSSASLRWLDAQPPNLNEAREAIIRTISDANRAAEVIGRIRALVTKAPPETGRVDFNQVIRGVVALSGNELLRGGITVTTNLSDRIPAVLADRIQLEQAVMNLVVNSVDAMALVTDRPRQMFIKTEEEGNRILVQIQDSGKGFDPEQTDQLFEPFFSTKAGGIGLGLSISRSIIETHGGRLWATPTSPHGALFQFTLPTKDSDT